ncbi:MAG: hypothetical protein AAFY41_05335 [Bacteroidota bacterium]
MLISSVKSASPLYGIEVGQLFIVLLFTILLWIYTSIMKGDHYKWNLFISGAGFGIAATIFLNAIQG